jgi:hypothetical protein
MYFLSADSGLSCEIFWKYFRFEGTAIFLIGSAHRPLLEYNALLVNGLKALK